MNRTPLYTPQERAGATFIHLFDWEVASTFGDAAAEYRAATDGVALLDLSYAGRFRVTGKDALDLLNRLSSNKVDVLPPGTGAGTVLPTNKGRVIDLLHLFATEDHLIMVTSPQTRQRVAEWTDLYTFLEDVVPEDVTEATAMLALLGPQAPALLERLTGTPVARMEPYASAPVTVDGKAALLLRTDPVGSPGYYLITPVERAESLWSALAADATPIGEEIYNALRIEAGLPRYGWELSEEVNPWEVALHPFIHFDKGCYTGQEVILRLYNYKKVQRQLVALTLSPAGGVEGATLRHGDKEAGRVTSAVQHPLSGETIGLGVVRAAFSDPDTRLEVVNAQGDRVAEAVVRETPAGVAVPS